MEQTTQFLSKRDGIDKTLKVLRYSIKLALATDLLHHAEVVKRLTDLEASIGTSRKAYRLGKFLQNVNAARKTPLRAPHASLELLANVGEGTYYFVDQFLWLVKVGVLPSSWGHRLSRISAGSELIGYVASISLTILRIHNLLEREVALIAELQRRRREKSLRATYATLYGGNAVASLDSTLTEDEKEHALVSEIRALRSRRALRTLSLAQDVADMCLAIADVRGAGTGTSRGLLSNRAFLAAAGLLSGCISAYKNWPGVMK